MDDDAASRVDRGILEDVLCINTRYIHFLFKNKCMIFQIEKGYKIICYDIFVIRERHVGD